MPKSAPSPRKARLTPSPIRRRTPQLPSRPKTAPSPIRRRTPQLPRKAKSAPLPSKPKMVLSPIMPRKTSPPKISNIPDEIRLKVLSYALNSDGNIILNNDFIKNYFQSMSNIFAVNKSYKATIPFITPSLKNIRIINLQKLTITKEILGILKMVDNKKIITIVLRGITFDNNKILDNFVEFFSNNTKVRIVVVDNIKVKSEEILEILGTFKELKYLEIKNTELSVDTFYPFVKVLGLKSLDFLTFTNNTVDGYYHNFLFTRNDSNTIDIDGIRYYVYIRHFHDVWELIIKTAGNNTIHNTIQINIVNNKIYGRTFNTNNYHNKFAFKFLQ